MPPLITPRLTLRSFAPSDWDAVRAMLADPLTTRFMHFAALTDAEGRAWFDWCVAHARQPDVNPRYRTIVRNDTGVVIGWIGVGVSGEPEAVAGERSVGYLLDHRWWNHGYMTEALRAVLIDELRQRGTPQIRATCDVTNPASARVMEKAGMRHAQTVVSVDAHGNETQRHHFTLTQADDPT